LVYTKTLALVEFEYRVKEPIELLRVEVIFIDLLLLH
jgi:hypothetical protein